MTTTTTNTTEPPSPAFSFPKIHTFPPFYTLQPNTTTLQVQLTSWSSIIRSYCRHQRLFKLSLSDALETDLFVNRALKKRLKAADARRVLKFMRDEEKTAEPVVGGKGGGGDEANLWWIWWRSVEEWAGLVERWVGCLGGFVGLRERGRLIGKYRWMMRD